MNQAMYNVACRLSGALSSVRDAEAAMAQHANTPEVTLTEAEREIFNRVSRLRGEVAMTMALATEMSR